MTRTTGTTNGTTRPLARAGVGLALLGGLVVVAAVPASAATSMPATHAHTRSHAAQPAQRGTVHLGPAVAYVRGADGSVHRVR